jgi:hypothetical protein
MLVSVIDYWLCGKVPGSIISQHAILPMEIPITMSTLTTLPILKDFGPMFIILMERNNKDQLDLSSMEILMPVEYNMMSPIQQYPI